MIRYFMYSASLRFSFIWLFVENYHIVATVGGVLYENVEILKNFIFIIFHSHFESKPSSTEAYFSMFHKQIIWLLYSRIPNAISMIINEQTKRTVQFKSNFFIELHNQPPKIEPAKVVATLLKFISACC